VFIQIGYTCAYIGPGSPDKRPLIDVQLFAPRKQRNENGGAIGYRRIGFYLRIGSWHTLHVVDA
jgi:hypothetical protein